MSDTECWERFCNWLEAKPWRWRYDRIWRGIQGDPPFLRRLWWTVTFPHVHHDDEGAIEADARALARYLDWMLRGDWITVGIPPTGRPMERAELDALLARYRGQP